MDERAGEGLAPVPKYRDEAPQRRVLVAETFMQLAWCTPSILRFVTILSCAYLFLALTPSAKAQTLDVSGSYQCTQAKVKGKVYTCDAAPLILKNDGHFELRGWEGTYMVEGQWVQLSDSLTKARAKIEPGHKIVLRYYGKHGWAEMTYERRIAELGKTSLI